MMDALKLMVDNGCSYKALEAVLYDMIDCNSFEDDGDKLCCIALYHDIGQGDENDPDDYTISHGDVVDAACGYYLVLDDDDANAMCRSRIKESLYTYSPIFLGSATNLDPDVFDALIALGEDSNEAIYTIIKGSCGLDYFVKEALTNGRGNFLAGYDTHEHEVSINGTEYFVYRIN